MSIFSLLKLGCIGILSCAYCFELGCMSFNIEFDYRFDTNGFFSDPARRNALEAAANVWENYIQDEFPNVPAGISFNVGNPQTGQTTPITLTSEIDDLLIFVGAASPPFNNRNFINAGAIGGLAGFDAVGSVFSARLIGSNFEPYVGILSFNTNPQINGQAVPWFFDETPNTSNDLPIGSSYYDFTAAAVHEIGHILGFGAPIFRQLVIDGYFTGPNARTVKVGNGIPIANDGSLSHISSDFPSLMNPTAQARLPGQAELAILADIGYQIAGFQTQGETLPIATEGDDQIIGTVLGDIINGLGGADRIFANAGNDTVLGLTGDDFIDGKENDDILFGNQNNDNIFGGQGNDIIYGGRNEDYLSGDDGNDILSGDRGNDQLFGGAGRDTFVFRAESGADQINDFVLADDVIQIGVGLGFNNGTDVLRAMTNSSLTTGGFFSQITLSQGNTITVFSDAALTAANFAIAGVTNL
ncbi:hypothetical protein [Aerosakkonema funiforme]|uniref:hypothetical protein n=1 Tax=Aerosakkonema funiforme TaxID=1246630 RepID=UPI0035BC3A87